MELLSKPKRINLTLLSPLLAALFLTLFDNFSLWQALFKIKGGFAAETLIYYLPFFIVLTLVYTLFFSLFNYRCLFKTLSIFLLMTASIAAYFMDSFGVMIDKTMIQNVVETDPKETIELLSLKMLYYLVFLGIAPSIIIYKWQRQNKPFLKQTLSNIIVAFICLFIIATTVFKYYGDFAPLYRSNRYVRHLINPVNYIKSISSNIKRLTKQKDIPFKQIGLDATQKPVVTPDLINKNHKTLTILVVGETARAKNFSLNGYSRETNPRLKQEKIIFYNNVYSCGTATATSVPCMFSLMTHDNYNDSDAKHTEGLLDVLKHAGIEVLWRNNNSGCKGTCDRINYQDFSHLQDQEFCNSSECFDEILLKGLQQYIDKQDKNLLIVLHQKGSHGPSYYLRVPEQFKIFKPICENSQVNECSKESLVNAYDNTIVYTDYFLTKVIKFLKQNSNKYNTAMIYVSDHGESLGEDNMYLHGLPYSLAPDEQIHVPLVLWLSDQIKSSQGINEQCLKQKSIARYSHDYLFHSILDLMNIKTKIYNPELDLFVACKK